jgi:hypothetical protein
VTIYASFNDEQASAELVVVTEGTYVWRLPKNSSIDKASHFNKALDDEKWHDCYSSELKPALLFTTEIAPEQYQYRFEEAEANGSGGGATFVLNKALAKAMTWGKLIECKLELDTRSDARATLLQEISESMRGQACRISMLERKVEEGKEAVEKTTALLDKETKVKDEALREALVKFMLILNSKKREIARLRGERGADTDNSDDDDDNDEEEAGHGSEEEGSKKQVIRTNELAFVAEAVKAAASKKRKNGEGSMGRGSSSHAAKKGRSMNQSGSASLSSSAMSQSIQRVHVTESSNWQSSARPPAAVTASVAAPVAAPPPKVPGKNGCKFIAADSDTDSN